MRNTRNIIILGLIIAILLMAVGYSAFATQLTLNGTAEIIGEWNIKITNVEAQNISEGANPGDPQYTDTTVNFDTKLEKPGDSVTYVITIENLGTIDAELASFAFVPDEKNGSSAISYVIEQPEKQLKAGEKTTCTIKVVFDEDITEMPEIKTKTIQGIIEYAQE